MMRSEVLDFCGREELFSPGEEVICALSGGADSMALLWCLHSLQAELDIHVSAAHFNHCLRGAASEGDEEFVRSFCEAQGIVLHTDRGDAAEHARQTGKSIEEAARELRYDYLLSLPCHKLATAHHADDNGETVLQHLLRGSGLRGLLGIPPKRGKIVRPLLCVTREGILDYLRQEGLSWREDGSNLEDDCLRNRLRHHVMPLLRQEEPNLSEKLLRQSRLLRQEDEFLDSLAAQLLEQADRGEGHYLCEELLKAPDALQKRALRLLVREHLPTDVSLRHIEAMQALLTAESPSAQISLPEGLIARRCYGTFELTRETPGSFPETVLHIPGETEIEELGIKISCKLAEKNEKIANTPFHFAVKYDMIAESILTARPRREGDRLRMKGGQSKSLKKLFIERKIPLLRRQRLPVIAAGSRILGVGGIGANEECLAESGSPALIIDIEKKEISYASRHRENSDF